MGTAFCLRHGAMASFRPHYNSRFDQSRPNSAHSIRRAGLDHAKSRIRGCQPAGQTGWIDIGVCDLTGDSLATTSASLTSWLQFGRRLIVAV